MDTRVTELLDSRGIKYRLLRHEKPAFTCEDASVQRGVSLEEMVKCMLLVDKKRRYFLVCTTSERRLDLKKVREALGCSRLSLASEKEIEDVLGYKLGAIPPLLLKTEIPVLFDNGIMRKGKVNISSGDPMAGLELDPRDLASLVKPGFGDFTQD
jgi:Cys-tRNA(Pro) deacylase